MSVLFKARRGAIAISSSPNSPEQFILKDEGSIRICYAPFEYVNTEAKLILCGLTPGVEQANAMIAEARRLIKFGKDDPDVLRECKSVGSFSGRMRSNLIKNLNYLGIASDLGIGDCSSLFDVNSHLVHFTSAFRFPVYEKQKGKWVTIKAKRKKSIAWVYEYFRDSLVSEFDSVPDARILPLGEGVQTVLNDMELPAHISKRLLPHTLNPGNENLTRLKYAWGEIDREQMKGANNAEKVDQCYDEFFKVVGRPRPKKV